MASVFYGQWSNNCGFLEVLPKFAHEGCQVGQFANCTVHSKNPDRIILHDIFIRVCSIDTGHIIVTFYLICSTTNEALVGVMTHVWSTRISVRVRPLIIWECGANKKSSEVRQKKLWSATVRKKIVCKNPHYTQSQKKRTLESCVSFWEECR